MQRGYLLRGVHSSPILHEVVLMAIKNRLFLAMAQRQCARDRCYVSCLCNLCAQSVR